MEVVVVHSPIGTPTKDHFDFNGARISPYLSAPSSPKRFGEFYLSAPTSPSRDDDDDGKDDFAFFVSRESEKSSRSAEELFDGGKIKPLKEEELSECARSPLLSPTRPKRSPIAQGKKVIREAFSPRKKKESSGDSSGSMEERRGRDRTPAASVISSSNSGRRVTRSHSPYRISHHTWDEEPHQPHTNKEDSISSSTTASSSSSSKSSRKWRLRDFLLFRSASEGRGSSKDPFRKFPVLYKKPEEGKASTFRSVDNPIPRSRRKEPVSAHELHYARKKAESEDLKKRTFLPYKQGILGRWAGFTR
ncbi:uncharacterized protein LOC133289313 [Gastrolobium bilobum]|uniref:uncharacterized protein LOC133289313 n=1 Tax=Gastrolobium bilobum TaxID=150636 RepID=UPI002AB1156D|nr:uncharacterized protein LOC133289313 [Gastrolobium bilobum]